MILENYIGGLRGLTGGLERDHAGKDRLGRRVRKGPKGV